MKIYKLLGFIMMMCIVNQIVLANAAVVAAVSGNYNRQMEEHRTALEKSLGIAPLDWAIEKNCNLEVHYNYPLGKYRCGNYFLYVNGTGGVYKVEQINSEEKLEFLEKVSAIGTWVGIVCAIIILLIMSVNILSHLHNGNKVKRRGQ